MEARERGLDRVSEVGRRPQDQRKGQVGQGDAAKAGPGPGTGPVHPPARQGQEHLPDIDPGGQAGGQGDAGDADELEQGQARRDVDPHRDQGEPHGALGVLVGEEGP